MATIYKIYPVSDGTNPGKVEKKVEGSYVEQTALGSPFSSDSDSLQATIDDAPVSGGRILLQPGTFVQDGLVAVDGNGDYVGDFDVKLPGGTVKGLASIWALYSGLFKDPDDLATLPISVGKEVLIEGSMNGEAYETTWTGPEYGLPSWMLHSANSVVRNINFVQNHPDTATRMVFSSPVLVFHPCTFEDCRVENYGFGIGGSIDCRDAFPRLKLLDDGSWDMNLSQKNYTNVRRNTFVNCGNMATMEGIAGVRMEDNIFGNPFGNYMSRHLSNFGMPTAVLWGWAHGIGRIGEFLDAIRAGIQSDVLFKGNDMSGTCWAFLTASTAGVEHTMLQNMRIVNNTFSGSSNHWNHILIEQGHSRGYGEFSDIYITHNTADGSGWPHTMVAVIERSPFGDVDGVTVSNNDCINLEQVLAVGNWTGGFNNIENVTAVSNDMRDAGSVTQDVHPWYTCYDIYGGKGRIVEAAGNLPTGGTGDVDDYVALAPFVADYWTLLPNGSPSVMTAEHKAKIERNKVISEKKSKEIRGTENREDGTHPQEVLDSLE